MEKMHRSEWSRVYHKVGEAGRLSLWITQANYGSLRTTSHWLVTLDGEVYNRDDNGRISLAKMHQQVGEWEAIHHRTRPDAVCPFALPEGTPKTWKKIANDCVD